MKRTSERNEGDRRKGEKREEEDGKKDGGEYNKGEKNSGDKKEHGEKERDEGKERDRCKGGGERSEVRGEGCEVRGARVRGARWELRGEKSIKIAPIPHACSPQEKQLKKNLLKLYQDLIKII